MGLRKYLDRFGTVITNRAAVAVYFPSKLSEEEKREVRNAIPMWVWFLYGIKSQYIEDPIDGAHMIFEVW